MERCYMTAGWDLLVLRLPVLLLARHQVSLKCSWQNLALFFLFKVKKQTETFMKRCFVRGFLFFLKKTIQNSDCEMKTHHKQPQRCCGTSLLRVSAVDCGQHIQCCLPACQQVAFFLPLSSIFGIHPRGRWFLSVLWGVAQQHLNA